ncbi:membrane protein [Microbacterium phage Armstrong]|uniref:Uncharacterized protein n=1 Tax=Microbacterium phage Armstrong TaxID=2419971 RepID=A0A3G2KD29_9CAUD|nr:membrane protein [Microbacterium phage Armstrong]AYN56908.1 hypothetical protein PBI_ARMSTRONG_22 [Microbacterium phage Armstrong]UGL61989.1 membrane protein [Microbacterium phage Skylord]UOK18175.1 membrane protein [Microbacterium phage Clayda5]
MSLTPRSDYQDAIAKSATTQTEHPWKATLRTLVQVGIPALIGIGVVVPEVIQIILDGFGETMSVEVRAWFLAAAAAVTAGAGVLARIMAIPLVNEFLTKIGLGAAPKG